MTKIANYLLLEKEDDLVTIRMTAELQDDVGTIGYIDFTKEEHLAKEDVILNLEASKTVMEIVSPIAGRIVKINHAASDTPTLLNSEKATENWLCVLADVDATEFDALEDA
ncbi:glycine cleavage system H protein [Granulicatella balaenopterae]|uniref:Glycine cleavage system H protein n=1 Tax=Granulicatella balaenopterae TaxID=137733 RepID=A0A1H9GWV4_9LACT|nr:glycine cleavage system protein H [Granulicatella balaenopterae]SEQ54602.1 glycine cleavage system H protein [Granulicatella balaenopterae]